MDYRIELIPLAVTDVDRAKAFYGDTVGWNVDSTRWSAPSCASCRSPRPGSACSICFGTGLEMMAEGSSQFIQVVVEDADAALAELQGRGVGVPGRRRAAVGALRLLRGPRRQPLGAAADRPALLR